VLDLRGTRLQGRAQEPDKEAVIEGWELVGGRGLGSGELSDDAPLSNQPFSGHGHERLRYPGSNAPEGAAACS